MKVKARDLRPGDVRDLDRFGLLCVRAVEPHADDELWITYDGEGPGWGHEINPDEDVEVL